MSTFIPKKEDILSQRKWYVVDAAGVPIGRVASFVASVLRGKRNPMFTPHLDLGDNVIVVNAEKVLYTGNKAKTKVYRRHSSRPGHLKEITAEKLLVKHPIRPLELAVKGMLPKNKLGRAMYRKLHVFAGPEHNHQAQQPVALEIER